MKPALLVIVLMFGASGLSEPPLSPHFYKSGAQVSSPAPSLFVSPFGLAALPPDAAASWRPICMSLKPAPAGIEPRVFAVVPPTPEPEVSKWQSIHAAERINVQMQQRRQEMFEQRSRSPSSEHRTEPAPLGPEVFAA